MSAGASDRNLEDRTTPIGLFHYAHAYAASAIALATIKIATTHSDAPVRFLFSHAIELYLKSYLLLQRVTIQELRSRAFGHNLMELTTKAAELGLSISDEHRRWMELANEAISDRYIETGSRTVLLPESLSAICAELHAQIGSAAYLHAGLKREPKQFC